MDTKTEKQAEANRVIDAIGGTSETARLCEISDPAVSQWRDEGIPQARMMFLRLARPDVFSKLDADTKPDAATIPDEAKREVTGPVMRGTPSVEQVTT